MNKKRVEEMIPFALEAINNDKALFFQGNQIKKAYRSQISAFGAAVVNGSFKAAVAYFSADAEGGKADIKRSELVRLMAYIDAKYRGCPDVKLEKADTIFRRVIESNDSDMEEEFLDASLAIKLALNAFDLV